MDEDPGKTTKKITKSEQIKKTKQW